MLNRPILNLFLLIILGGVLNYYITASNVTAETKKELKLANEEYFKGETATTLGERQTAFNKALTLYTNFEKKYHPTFGNGKLYYNIANAYFQVEEYPRAILYYYRARSLMPRSNKVEHNLGIALDKLNMHQQPKKSAFDKIFFLHQKFSLPERLQYFFLFALFGTLAGSLYVWKKIKWLKNSAICFAILTGLILCSLAYGHYITPSEGVVVRATALYRDAGLQYAKVLEEPILSGLKVEVLDTTEDGKWLKIFTPDGDLGYIPQESIRII